MNYVHTAELYPGGNEGASNFYTRFNDIAGLSAAHSQLPASASAEVGDVAVWSSDFPGLDGSGHIAVVTGVSGNTVSILQQNGAGSPGRVSAGSFPSGDRYLLGYLRPKNLG